MISSSLYIDVISVGNGTSRETKLNLKKTRYSKNMRDKGPQDNHDILGQAAKIVEEASKELARHFDAFVFEVIGTEYRTHSFLVPPMLTSYIEYCKEEQQPINVLGWIDHEAQHHIIPQPEMDEITTIGTIMHVLTRVQQVKGEEAKIEALSEADSLKTLFATLPQEKSALLARIFSEQLNGIINT